MPYRLTLSLGGICLFVYRQNDQDGLVALMPRDLMHGHRPQIIIGENMPNDGYLAGDYDWRRKIAGSTKKTAISQAAHFTDLTGKKAYVPSRMFDPTKPDAVQARFFLPWPLQVNWGPEKPVKIKTLEKQPKPPKPQKPSKPNKDPISGEVELVYEFSKNLVFDKFDDDDNPMKHTIDATGDQKIVIANVMSTSVNRGSFPDQTPIPHATLFYELLEGCNGYTPALQTAEPYNNTVKPLGPTTKASNTTRTAFAPTYINPVECIIGTGCEQGYEGQPACE